MFGNDGNDSDKPGIEEMYELATNASNLKQEAERRTAADVLRDMAMSTDRLGAALRRLRGQWEAVEKPTRQRTRSVKEWVEILPLVEEGGRMVPDRVGAEEANREERERHDHWYERELLRLIAHLADLQPVCAALTIQAVKWGIENAEAKAGAVVRYWLDQKCNACDGRKWQLIPGSPSLSNRVCKVCQGSGVGQVQHGQEGRRLANHMDQCLSRHRQTMKARRKALAAIPPIDRLSKRMQSDDED